MGKTFHKFRNKDESIDDQHGVHQKRASHKGHARHPSAMETLLEQDNDHKDLQFDPAYRKLMREMKRME